MASFALVVGAGTFWLSLNWAHTQKDTSVVLSFLGAGLAFMLASSYSSYHLSRGEEQLALLFSASTHALKRSSAFLHGRGVIKSTRRRKAIMQLPSPGFGESPKNP